MKINMIIPVLVSILISQSVMFSGATNVENKEDTLSRIYGENRYETNIATINSSFGDYSQVAIGSNSDNTQTVKAINHSIDKSIPFVLGKNNNSNLSNINGIRDGVTSVDLNSSTNLRNAVIVNHMSDLITALTYVTKYKAEIIFNDGTNLPNMSKYNKVLIVGGRVKNTMGYEQISGKDRYETNRLVNAKYGTGHGYLVSGENTADAISCVNMVINKPMDIILTKNDGSSVDVNNTSIEAIIGGAVKIQRKILYVNPHQDDEVLTMGLSLLRDATNNRKNTYLMLMTDGSKSYAIKLVNGRLKSEGRREISVTEMVNARNREMIDCFTRMNGDKNNIIINSYKNLELKNEDVYREIEKFYNKYKNIELKTMAVNEYDKSKGAIDHKACRDGSLNFARNKNVKITLYSENGGKTMSITDNEKNKIIHAAKAYTVYNPSAGRYAVGYTSVKHMFSRFENNDFTFGIVEVE